MEDQKLQWKSEPKINNRNDSYLLATTAVPITSYEDELVVPDSTSLELNMDVDTTNDTSIDTSIDTSSVVSSSSPEYSGLESHNTSTCDFGSSSQVNLRNITPPATEAWTCSERLPSSRLPSTANCQPEPALKTPIDNPKPDQTCETFMAILIFYIIVCIGIIIWLWICKYNTAMI